MILDIDFLIDFFTKYSYKDTKNEMGEQDDVAASPSSGGGSVPKWSDTYNITRGKANMLGLAGEKHSTGLTRGAANQIW
jgi:hypothetical protein